MNPIVGMLIIFVPIILVGLWMYTPSARKFLVKKRNIGENNTLEIQSICKSTHKFLWVLFS